ncbi:MAG: S8 family serine peptidase [Candidatus Aquicultor sp.]|nr:S8 family serine peptidase [Candidatus Aquicultor sp.]
MGFLHSENLRKTAFFVSFFLILSYLNLSIAAVGANPAGNTGYTPDAGVSESAHAKRVSAASAGAARPDELLVRFKAGVDQAAADALHREVAARPLSIIKKLDIARVFIESGTVDEAAHYYMESGLVEFAEPNYRRTATDFIPNDPLYADQWGLSKIGMGKAWELAGSAQTQVKVAVLDTGVDPNHEDLKDSLAINTSNGGKVLGKRFFVDGSGKQGSDDNFTDEAGHGTHISGIIAAKTNNSLGVAGIASTARIMPVKVLDDIGFGDDGSIALGLMWAADNGARIINMSLAGPTPSKTLGEAVKYAQGKGALIVAATGNDGSGTPNYPAAYEGVIGVGAVDSKDAWIHQSNFGQHVDVVAPGVSILSTFLASKSYDGQAYEANSGTSMATGVVSGLAALLLAINPALTPERVEGIIDVSADDLGAAGWDRYYGHGRINAGEAVQISTISTKPAVTIVSPANNTQITKSIMPVSANASSANAGIAFVEFYLNGVRQGTVVAPPYVFNVNTGDLFGKNTIKAQAYDENGNTASAEITCYKQTFSDVGAEYWAFEDIETLASEKVLAGYPGGIFMPTKAVGRAEFVKMLVESLGFSKKSSYSGYFKDVSSAHWAWPYIEAAYDLGMISGYGENLFQPEAQIKRVEMAAMLLRSGAYSLDYSGTTFNDVSPGHWGFVSVMSARNASVITGYSGNYFRPEQAMSRAEAARVIKNALY